VADFIRWVNQQRWTMLCYFVSLVCFVVSTAFSELVVRLMPVVLPV
jgi:hypothetical protein